MNSNRKHQFAFLMLIMASIYGGYIAYNINTPIKKVVTESPLVISGLSVTNYDQNGAALKKFKVKKLLHFDKKNTSYLTNPVIHVTQGDNSWYITALHGQTYAGNSKVRLFGAVNIHQKNNKQTQHVKTEVLWYYPKKHLAISHKIIHYKRDDDVAITAKGMRVNLDNKHIELLNQVKATYSDNKKHNNHHENT